MRALTAGIVRISPVFFLTKIASGTPQARWRDSTQSGRVSTMAPMRLRPRGGYQCGVVDAPSSPVRAASCRRISPAACRARRTIAAWRDRSPAPWNASYADRNGASVPLASSAPAFDQCLDDRAIGIAILAFRREDALAGEERHVADRRSRLRRRSSGSRYRCPSLRVRISCRATVRSLLRHGRARCARSPCRYRR